MEFLFDYGRLVSYLDNRQIEGFAKTVHRPMPSEWAVPLSFRLARKRDAHARAADDRHLFDEIVNAAHATFGGNRARPVRLSQPLAGNQSQKERGNIERFSSRN
jgi:hypothetical protein